jgi:hypothetical protein
VLQSQLNRLTAGGLAREIAQRRVSPVEAVEAALARIAETEPSLDAFVQVDVEGALAAARRAEDDITAGRPLGHLHGVPVSIKDLIDVEGLTPLPSADCGLRALSSSPIVSVWPRRRSLMRLRQHSARCALSASKLSNAGTDTMKLRHAKSTSPSTLPLSLPIAGRPKRSWNR